ncbi:ESPR-type extended signal peptide-containing protein, partial [Psychrobacter sp. 2Y5]|uniref:ESPR-type extended signal peptide-containing protein n=1 Tax=unclassified Psychrobacter TaxID=196806 RepID=UPI003F465E83
MNRNFKVVWNRSLGCFTAVAEYAKSRGKSSSTTVTSGASTSATVVTGGAKVLCWSALCTGMIAAGFSMQASAACTASTTSFNCGSGSSASTNGVAIGTNATATANQAIAIGGGNGGKDTTASGDQSIAIGGNTLAQGNSSIAIGGDDLDSASKTNVNGTIASDDLNSGSVNTIFKDISGRDLVDPTNNTTRYPNTASSGAASVAVGVQAVSKGALSTAFGTQTKADGVASAAFGVSAQATKDGSVAIGAGSSTLQNANNVTNATVNGYNYGNFAGSTGILAGDQVSVGSAGRERQIKSVAAGNITSTSTDAINGSQLFSVARTLSDAQPVVYTDTNGNRVYKQANGNFTTNPDGTGTTVANNNVQTSILAANGTTNTPTKLTNVAAGAINASSTDAVNGSQLNTTNTKVANNTTALGGSYNLAGTYTAPVYNIVTDPSSTTTTPFNTVKGAVETLSGAVQTPLTFAGDRGDNVTRKLGTTLNVKGGAPATATLTDNNIGVVANNTDKSLTVKLAQNVDLGPNGSVKTGATTVNNTGVTITNTATPANSVSLTNTGLNNGNQTITNVASGGSTTTNAANIGDVNTAITGLTNKGFTISVAGGTQDKVKLGENVDFTNDDGNLVVTKTADNTINYDLADNITVNQATIGNPTGENTVLTSTANGLDVGGDKITNVANGDISTGSTDAVNGGQLSATNDRV